MGTSADHLYLEEIKDLPREERLRLAHRILQDLVSEESASAPRVKSLLDLYGLGREIWEGVDPDRYVDELRGEWEPER